MFGLRFHPRVSGSTKCFVLFVRGRGWSRAAVKIKWKPRSRTIFYLQMQKLKSKSTWKSTSMGSTSKQKLIMTNRDLDCSPAVLLVAPTRHWSPDWCMRRSCRTVSRWGIPRDLPRACWRSWRRRARPPCSSPPRSSRRRRGSPCGCLNRHRDTGCRCRSCCDSACSGTPRRSRETAAGLRWRASSPRESPSAEREKKNHRDTKYVNLLKRMICCILTILHCKQL